MSKALPDSVKLLSAQLLASSWAGIVCQHVNSLDDAPNRDIAHHEGR
jgi:hypothetical protein